MSEIKALEKLRGLRDEAASKMVDNPKWVCKRAEEIADEIEAEIAERYMLAPVDADGVPVHVGDVIQFVNEQGGTGAKVEVCAVSDYYAYYGEGKHFYRADCCRHVEPRTLEDVLRDCVDTYNDDRTWHRTDDTPEEFFRRYADEIREMMGEEC